MTTSGTYAFDPSLGEIVLYAYNMIGIRNTSLTQEHMQAARIASNMVLANWSNKGVNLWTVDLQTVTLIAGQATYSVPENTVIMLDAYIRIDNGSSPPIDRLILPISRTEYASYPNKEQEGFPTVFWQDRLISGNVTLWPVPDGTSAQYLRYYRARQLQDSEFTGGQTVEIPYLWLDAFADALAYRLSRVWNPEMTGPLKSIADESYNIADAQNVEQAAQYITPMVSGYFRP
jgi:hypothetical protein